MAVSLISSKSGDVYPFPGACSSTGAVNQITICGCCPFQLDAAGGTYGSSAYIAGHRIFFNFCRDRAWTLNITWDSFSGCYNEFQVCVGGSLSYSTGCVLGTGSHNVSVPSGTTTVSVYWTGNCTGIPDCDDLWTVVVSCV